MRLLEQSESSASGTPDRVNKSGRELERRQTIANKGGQTYVIRLYLALTATNI